MPKDLISKLAGTRAEIAALIATELGLGDPTTWNAADREAVERQTTETIEGCAIDAASDCEEAGSQLQQRLRDHRALLELRSDEADARLAEEGEVFGREDDA